MVARIWAIGATDVIQQGNTIAEAQAYVQSRLLQDDPTGIYVPPFDHQDIWDGNASIMDEISTQLPNGGQPDAILCSIGGGGLMNGIMQFIDLHQSDLDLQHKTHIIATETRGADSLSQSLDAGKVITLPKITSAATSLGVVRVSEKTFEYAQHPNVHSVVISDEEAAKGCCLLAEHDRLMTELTVGVNVPVCYDGMLQRLLGDKKRLTKDSKVVIVCCGGNDISIDMLVSWRLAMLEKEAAYADKQEASMRHELASKVAGVTA
jgi:L-serine/L-threonine ammonia-lyase